MLIDRSHRGWLVATLILFAVSTGLYVWYVQAMPNQTSGGTVPGLLFGVAGSLLMIYAGLLGARKKVPTWKIGRASTWLKGHIWLGLLSVPLILYHASFRLGGLLEQSLWAALFFVIASGIFGMVMQAKLPRTMSMRVPLETIYEQIPHVCKVMQVQADELVTSVCGLLDVPSPFGEEGETKRKGKVPEAKAGSEPLKKFYLDEVRPFLGETYLRSSALSISSTAQSRFAQMGKRLGPDFEPVLDGLERSCEERRQFAQQVWLHHWLHGWLFLHIPLSFALLGLGIAHVVLTLYY